MESAPRKMNQCCHGNGNDEYEQSIPIFHACSILHTKIHFIPSHPYFFKDKEPYCSAEACSFIILAVTYIPGRN